MANMKGKRKFWQEKSEEKLFGKEDAKKLGNYDENTGGGTPIPKGKTAEDVNIKVVDNVQEADRVRAQEKNLPDSQKSTIRVKQPRNEDGTFGYNAQNRKGLRYESRGKSNPSFLEGLVSKWYKEGKKSTDIVTSEDIGYLGEMDLTLEEFVERCKYYLEGDKLFGALGKKGETGIKAKDRGTSELLSNQAGKGLNKKKVGPFTKKAQPTEQPQPTVETDKDEYTDKSGVKRTGDEMRSALDKFNKKLESAGKKGISMREFRRAYTDGKLDKILDKLF